MQKNKIARLGGLGIAILAFGCALWDWNYTLNQAKMHAPVIYLAKGFALLVSFGITGIILMIFGNKFQAYSKGLKTRRKNWLDYVFFAILIIPGFAAYLCLENQVEQYGYSSDTIAIDNQK